MDAPSTPFDPKSSASLKLAQALRQLDVPFFVAGPRHAPHVVRTVGLAEVEVCRERVGSYPDAYVPALSAGMLGDPDFRREFGLKFAYLGGAMANGIASAKMVIALGQAGMMAEFGAAGLDLARIESEIVAINDVLGSRQSWACNLIHSPQEPELERATVDLFLRHGVRCASASAFMGLSPEIVRYRLAGIAQRPDGSVYAPNRLIAKVSRLEVARKFMSPAPADMLAQLTKSGAITPVQAKLAERIPVAQALTIEADSGGHTDNRPMLAQFPAMVVLRDALVREHAYEQAIHLGAAGGLGTPQAVHGAFSLGAAFVVTGSINQACVESGTSDLVRELLVKADPADVAMAPAGDMFELGVKVQVLKRGTMFAMRGQKLYEIYRSRAALEEISPSERSFLEGQIFRQTLEQAWLSTAEYWQNRDPATLHRAASDAKHKMALLFRSYLGQSSRWANGGLAERQADFQIWCGPAMGAFNEWVRGSVLEPRSSRSVVPVARALLRGAATLARAGMVRAQGYAISPNELGLEPSAIDFEATKEELS